MTQDELCALGEIALTAANAALQKAYDTGMPKLIPVLILAGTDSSHFDGLVLTSLPTPPTIMLLRLLADKMEQAPETEWIERPQ